MARIPGARGLAGTGRHGAGHGRGQPRVVTAGPELRRRRLADEGSALVRVVLAQQQVELEARFGDEVAAELRERGHDVEVTGDWSLGRVSAVAWEDGLLKAAANPRGMQGYAVGR